MLHFSTQQTVLHTMLLFVACLFFDTTNTLSAQQGRLHTIYWSHGFPCQKQSPNLNCFCHCTLVKWCSEIFCWFRKQFSSQTNPDIWRNTSNWIKKKKRQAHSSIKINLILDYANLAKKKSLNNLPISNRLWRRWSNINTLPVIRKPSNTLLLGLLQ